MPSKSFQTGNVTRFDKTGLITFVSSLDFFSQTQRYMNKLLISLSLQVTIQWSAFPGCFFFKAQW